jgi:predicted 3-demethylubiquinone-9 3-methyltransferase (glyoxalase superfamily)
VRRIIEQETPHAPLNEVKQWSIFWQSTPRVLMEAMAAVGAEANRAFEAMMTMRKIDVAAIKAARRG